MSNKTMLRIDRDVLRTMEQGRSEKAERRQRVLEAQEIQQVSSHASDHETGGTDEIDGDKLDIDYTPTNYTPSTLPTEADNVDNLTAHLYGINSELGSKVDRDGSTILTGDWDIGNGRHIAGNEIRARDGSGLKLYDDSGSDGMFVEDGGHVGIGTTSPSCTLHIATGADAALATEQSGYLIIGSSSSIHIVMDNNEIMAKSNGTSTNTLNIQLEGGRTFFGDTIDIDSDTIRIRDNKTPANASATGSKGEIVWDANYIYVCTGTNTWKRASISTW